MRTITFSEARYRIASHRYLKLCHWAEHRYSYRDARGRRCWNLTLPGGAPAPYTRIECAAWNRYMRDRAALEL